MIRVTPIYFKVLVGVLLLWFAFNCAKSGRDFEVFVSAGGRIISGVDLYRPLYNRGLQYFYSPLFALLLAPFSYLPIVVPQLIWVLLSYFFIYRIWVLSGMYFDTPAFSRKQYQWWIVLSLFFSVRFLRHDLAMVQMTIFLLWATLQSMQLFKDKQTITGAALLALAINIKLLPLAFVCYLLYTKNLKAALLTGVFYVAYLFIPALYLGWDRNYLLLHEWFSAINPINKNWTIEADDGPSSLVALIPVYITNTIGLLPYKRNFINLNYQQVLLIVNIVRAFFVVLALVFICPGWVKKPATGIRQYWEMCYLFIVIPLIYPHQQQYAFVYIIPAFIYFSWYVINYWDNLKSRLNTIGWIAIGLVAVNFTPIIGRDIISGKAFELLLYYRVLPIAAVALIPLLWLCRPKVSDAEIIKV